MRKSTRLRTKTSGNLVTLLLLRVAVCVCVVVSQRYDCAHIDRRWYLYMEKCGNIGGIQVQVQVLSLLVAYFMPAINTGFVCVCVCACANTTPIIMFVWCFPAFF